MEPRDFFLKALVLHGYPLGRQVMAKLNLLPQLLSTFVCVLPCAAFSLALQFTALIMTALFCRLRAGGCMEPDSIYVFCITLLLTDPAEEEEVAPHHPLEARLRAARPPTAQCPAQCPAWRLHPSTAQHGS